jgi:uncharacterized protein YlzI (FlbEa/FlbD family)
MRVVLLATLIVLHTLDGREIDINPKQITSMREAREDDEGGKAFTPGVRCMVNTTDGKFVTVTETCEEVRRKLEEHR